LIVVPRFYFRRKRRPRIPDDVQLVAPTKVVGGAGRDVAGARDHPDTFSTIDSTRGEKNFRRRGACRGGRKFRRSMIGRAT
jgi:hypothetical protein